MGGDAGGEGGAVAEALDDAGDEGGAVQLAHLAGHADVAVHQGLVVDDHVLVGLGRVAAALEPVRRPPEQVRPRVDLDEVQQRDDRQRPRLRPRRLAVQEQVEQLHADRVALRVESAGLRKGDLGLVFLGFALVFSLSLSSLICKGKRGEEGGGGFK